MNHDFRDLRGSGGNRQTLFIKIIFLSFNKALYLFPLNPALVIKVNRDSMHYVKHLSKDEKLRKLIKDHGVFKLNKKKNLYLYLCYSIMSQQLSTKVASVIKQRFIDLYGGEPTPEQIVDTPFEKLRAIGFPLS